MMKFVVGLTALVVATTPASAQGLADFLGALNFQQYEQRLPDGTKETMAVIQFGPVQCRFVQQTQVERSRSKFTCDPPRAQQGPPPGPPPEFERQYHVVPPPPVNDYQPFQYRPCRGPYPC
jgi:hypothetical protein